MSWAQGGAVSGRGRDVHSLLRVSHSVILTELTSHTYTHVTTLTENTHLRFLIKKLFPWNNFSFSAKFLKKSWSFYSIVRKNDIVVTENWGCHRRDNSRENCELVTCSTRQETDTWHVTWAISRPCHPDSDGTRAIPSMSRRTLSRLKISYFLLFLLISAPGVRYLSFKSIFDLWVTWFFLHDCNRSQSGFQVLKRIDLWAFFWAK